MVLFLDHFLRVARKRCYPEQLISLNVVQTPMAPNSLPLQETFSIRDGAGQRLKRCACCILAAKQDR
jgi:hypothetical protein